MVENISSHKARLEQELADLTAELKTIGIHDPENTENWIERANDLDTVSADQNEVADRTEEWGERRSTVAVLEGRYNDITHALRKIEDGTYGLCEVCKTEIKPGRLSANPSARTCEAHMGAEENVPVE